MPRTRRVKKTGGGRFTRRDYSSKNGMMTTIWGPPMWHFLHTMSFNYPVEPSPAEKSNYKSFVRSLKNVLPCGKCRENLRGNLKAVPLKASDLASRYAFSRWMYRFHEHVNKTLGKRSGLTYDAVRDRYEHFRARCVAETHKVESGCTGKMGPRRKSKCVLKIVPHDDACETLEIDDRCRL